MNNEERIIPRIEEAPMLQPTVSDPRPAQQRVLLPQSVVAAVHLHHNRMKEAELTRLQNLYESGNFTEEQITLLANAGIIEQPKNIFQLLQEKSMEALLAMVVNYLKNNLRTTVMAFVFVLAQIAAKFQLELPQAFSDVLYAISYIFVFTQADRKITMRMIAGSLLTVFTLFIPILAGPLGLAANPLLMNGLLFGLQQLVAILLKEQPELQEVARRTGALPTQATAILVVGLLFFSMPAVAQETPCNRIPSSFRVHGTEISVRFDSAACEKADAWGLYDHHRALIRLNETDLYSADRLSETFYHEMTHCLLLSIEYDSLSSDEVFVARFSRVLRQAVCTFRYPEELLLQPRTGNTPLRRSTIPQRGLPSRFPSGLPSRQKQRYREPAPSVQSSLSRFAEIGAE